jgi:hypothetical protein
MSEAPTDNTPDEGTYTQSDIEELRQHRDTFEKLAEDGDATAKHAEKILKLLDEN